MSKLTTVRSALASNSDVIVHSEKEKLYLPNASSSWTHTVDIIAYPSEGMYEKETLQAFMMGLVPTLEPSCKDDFLGSLPGYMYFGKLYFDEPIGTDVTSGTRTITITDLDIVIPPTLQHDGHMAEVRETEEGREIILNLDSCGKRMRRIWVRVYPDAGYANRASYGGDVYETRTPASTIPRQAPRGRWLSGWRNRERLCDPA
jgi:hypothetical protein